MKDKLNVLNKHIATVHNSSPLSTIQRKLMNILLKNIGAEIDEDKEHIISLKILKNELGWSDQSKTPENLKESLIQLVTTKIEWNIFGQDRKSQWVASTLLASASIKDGNLYYSYSNPLRNLLKQPNIYAKLNLNIQKSLKIKHSVLMWEFFSGELSSKKNDYIITKWIDYQDILRLTFLENTVYQNRYKQFLDLVLTKAINEINLKSDLEIEYEIMKEKGKINNIRFIIQKKANPMIIHRPIKTDTPPIILELQKIGLPEKIFEEIILGNSEEQIVQSIEFFKYTMNHQPEKIHNPVAFFRKSLKEGWISPLAMQKNLLIIPDDKKIQHKENIKLSVDLKEEGIICKKIRYKIIEHIGEDHYYSWFDSVRFDIKDTSLVLNANKFITNWIESNYLSMLNEIITKFDLNQIEYTVK